MSEVVFNYLNHTPKVFPIRLFDLNDSVHKNVCEKANN